MEDVQDSDLDSKAAMLASIAFTDILNVIQSSNLNFQLQLSPFSAYISLKKSLVKDKTGAPFFPSTTPRIPSADAEDLAAKNYKLEQDISNLSKKYEDVAETLENSMIENKKLKETISEKDHQLESFTNKSHLLQTKLEKAECKMVKLTADTKEKEFKHSKEICDLKLRIKEDSETIDRLKTAATDASKAKKSLEKIIHNLENQIDNLNNKLETVQASRKDVKAEKDNLAREIKRLQKNSQQLKCIPAKSQSEANNNIPAMHHIISTFSRSVQTSQCQCSSPNPSVIPETVECFVCNKKFNEESNLKEHAAEEHSIELQLEKLSDFSEEDPFIRFVKSIHLGLNYISERLKLYPENWDHIEERIKFRMLAQKKLEICSKYIEENMMKNELVTAKNYDWAEV